MNIDGKDVRLVFREWCDGNENIIYADLFIDWSDNCRTEYMRQYSYDVKPCLNWSLKGQLNYIRKLIIENCQQNSEEMRNDLKRIMLQLFRIKFGLCQYKYKGLYYNLTHN